MTINSCWGAFIPCSAAIGSNMYKYNYLDQYSTEFEIVFRPVNILGQGEVVLVK
jgi:hypothetical protein